MYPSRGLSGTGLYKIQFNFYAHLRYPTMPSTPQVALLVKQSWMCLIQTVNLQCNTNFAISYDKLVSAYPYSSSFIPEYNPSLRVGW